jgi:acetyl-CoA carboxylase biotin carboxylase subunit
MQLPGGNGIRIDSGYSTGDEISPYYDSMVLKLIAFADDRDEAIRLSLAALGELTIDGIDHNTELARAMLSDADFRSGNVHTKWIEQSFLPRFLRGHA